MVHTIRRAGGLFAVALLCCGCGKGGDPGVQATRAKVSGKISYAGKPLQKGTIVFDAGAGTQPAVLDILDGKYEGLVTIGKNRVMINSTKQTTPRELYGKDGPGYDDPIEVNMLPARYGTESKVNREVAATGSNEFNFDLEAK